MDELYEKLADIQHQIWAHWMAYMFSCGESDGDGNWIMPKDKVVRWTSQQLKSYNRLSEKEKASDREQVDRYWPEIEALRQELDAKNKVVEVAKALIEHIDYVREHARQNTIPENLPLIEKSKRNQANLRQALKELEEGE